MSTIYVSPLGSGDASGSSAENAMAFTQLNAAIASAGPAGTVMLLADQGAYNTTTAVQISGGGTDGAPVTIMGVDSFGNPMDAQIYGTRAPVYVPQMTQKGNDVFVLASGADNLLFDGIDFFNVATPFHFAADTRNVTIQNMEADNVRLFAGNYHSDTYASATASGLTIRDVDVHGFSYACIALQYDTNNVVIERVLGDSEYEDGDTIAEGIHLNGTVHDVLIKDTTMMNCIHAGSYYNADGFATERGVYNVRFENTVATGNADGGYDLKSTGTVLVNAVAEDNARNFRLWGEIQLIDPVGIDPHKRGGSSGQYQLEIMDGANVTITGGWFVDSGSATNVVRDAGTGLVTFSGTHFVYAADLTSGAGASHISGIDMALAAPTSATGAYSTDAEIYVGGEVTPPPAPSVLTGTTGNDVLQAANDGNWIVNGLAGNDVITTGAGNDVISGGAGSDVISSGAGDDTIRFSGGSEGPDTIDAGAGVDRIEALKNGTVIGLMSVAGVEAVSANGFSSVSIAGTSAGDTFDFSSVTLTGITSIKGLAGNDTLYGSVAPDVIAGGAGADTIRGNGGADLFDYNALSESKASARDRILDFQVGSDKLDLLGVDAVSTVTGNQAFSFIGSGAFHKVAGELRLDMSDPIKTVVLGDVNGDGKADFAVELVGSLQLTVNDFIL
jgi:Ca2+-binding RTX toxin-like protein